MKEFPPSIPLLSHNCFALRGRGDLSSPSPFMFFSRASTPSALFFAAFPTSACCSPHQTPLNCSGFHCGEWGRCDKKQTLWKRHFPPARLWQTRWRGESFTWCPPHVTKNTLVWVCGTTASIMEGSPRRTNQLGFSVFCCPFQSLPYLCEFHLLSVPINLMSPQPRQSPCWPQAGPCGKK